MCTVRVCDPHLADTFVVKETQSVTKDSGVVPVMSSHWAGDVPPVRKQDELTAFPAKLCSSPHNPHPFIFSVLHLLSIDL